MKARYLIPLLCAAASCLVSCQRQRAYPVYFLTEARGTEAGSRFIIMYRGRPFTKLPILTLEHFEKFRSFINPDGSYGVELFIKKEWRTRLYLATQENIGLLMLPVINGLAFEPQRIDRAVTDGELVIWNGLNGYDLKQISKTVEPMTPEIEEKRYKDKNPRPLPQKPKNVQQTKDHTGRTFGELFHSVD